MLKVCSKFAQSLLRPLGFNPDPDLEQTLDPEANSEANSDTNPGANKKQIARVPPRQVATNIKQNMV